MNIVVYALKTWKPLQFSSFSGMPLPDMPDTAEQMSPDLWP